MNNIKIRKAQSEDAAEISNVHINSWREAYKGIIDQDYLDDLPLKFKKFTKIWTKSIAENEIIYIAESEKNGIVGFSNAGLGRDERFIGYGEIYCIYLFQKVHKKGIGFQLFKACTDDLKTQGMEKVYLWVVENNPTISFYEKIGGKKLDYIQTDTIGKQERREFCYSWESIDF